MPSISDRGRHMRSRHRHRWVMAGVLCSIAAISLGGFLILSPPAAPPGKAGAIGGPFALTDGKGRQVTDRDFRGKYLLVYFGYTFCPDVCPTTLNDVDAAMNQLGRKAEQVQPLFITVDPRRDTAEVIGQYAASFPHVIGLTGTTEQVGQAARVYRVAYAPHQTGPGPNDYTMDHSSVLYLMGPDGRFRAPIPADASAETIAAEVARYLT